MLGWHTRAPLSKIFLILGAVLWGVTGCSAPDRADLVLRGGTVATVDKEFSLKQAVAVRGGRFVYVGSDSGVEEYIGESTYENRTSSNEVCLSNHLAWYR